MSPSVSSSRSLVGSSAEHDPGRIDQRAGDDHAALFPAGPISPGKDCARLGQPHRLRERQRAGVGGLRAHGAGEQGGHGHVVDGGSGSTGGSGTGR